MKNAAFHHRLRFALAGLREAYKNEKSFRAQSYAAALALLALLILRPALEWWALVFVMCALVLAAELINTAIENLADHLHPEQHPKIRIMKDCAAAAVLVLSAAAAIVGVLMILSVIN